jgi:hypothetical protein
VDVPGLGKFGVDAGWNASFDYTVADGHWEVTVGKWSEASRGKRGRRPKFLGLTKDFKLYIGNKEIEGTFEGGARGNATIQKGITFDEIFCRSEFEGRFELGRLGLLDLVGPGLSSAAGRIPGLKDILSGVSAVLYLITDLNGEIILVLQPTLHCPSFQMTGKLGFEAAYEPRIGKVKLNLYIGGEGSATLGIPGELIRQLKLRFYTGAEVEVWVFKTIRVEYTFVDFTLPRAQARALGARDTGAEPNGVAVLVVSPGSDGVQPIERRYLAAGPERFVAMGPELQGAGGAGRSALETFRLLSRQPAKGSVTVASGTAPTPGGVQRQAVPKSVEGAGGPQAEASQADLTLVQNVFPDSSPAMASRGAELMLLYVSDNGSSNALQFTDIKWTRWDGTAWSVPASLHTNTQAEFNPQVAYDGNGDVIAAWERVADPNFNETNLTAMAAQMEIVWSRWNRASGQWSPPVVF